MDLGSPEIVLFNVIATKLVEKVLFLKSKSQNCLKVILPFFTLFLIPKPQFCLFIKILQFNLNLKSKIRINSKSGGKGLTVKKCSQIRR